MKIVIVEKDNRLAEIYSDVLKKQIEDCTYNLFQDGFDALNYIKYTRPEMIVLDSMSPGIMGIDLAKEICYIYNPIIILITNGVDLQLANKNNKFIDYVFSKPVDFRLFKSVIKEQLDSFNDDRLHQPRLMQKDTLVCNEDDLRDVILNVLKDVNVNLKTTDQEFLTDAIQVYIDPDKESMYKELSMKYNIVEDNAFKRLRAITHFINGRINLKMDNDDLILQLAEEVLKRG
ncbi:response regulator [Vallitalea okinawensis]|uniref:response regulator n=1 Tax=Vallitalea okinawensis TaxID=2078660 RepID=UPI0013003247|nr:response regulator [Vallitalea okinawensis]